MKLESNKITVGKNDLIFEVLVKEKEVPLPFLQKINACVNLPQETRELIIKLFLDQEDVLPTPQPVELRHLQTFVRLLTKNGVNHRIITWWTPNWCEYYHWEVGSFPTVLKEFFGNN